MRYRNPESGIALLAVLWILLLLSTLAATVAYRTRTNALLVHRRLESAQAEAAADSAVIETIRLLSDEQGKRHPLIDGSVIRSDYHGIPTEVTITQESGRIDINTASDELLEAFLDSHGVTETEGSKMVEDLRKWQHANMGSSPTVQSPMASIDALKQIPGWDAGQIECWRDALTVYTRLPGVSARNASAQVMAALRWAEARQFHGHEWIIDQASTIPVADTSVTGEVLRIEVAASASPEVNSRRIWVGRLSGSGQSPAATMMWSRPVTAVKSHSCGTHRSATEME